MHVGDYGRYIAGDDSEYPEADSAAPTARITGDTHINGQWYLIQIGTPGKSWQFLQRDPLRGERAISAGSKSGCSSRKI